MTTLDFARPGGVWANEMVPGASDFLRWDISQSKIVNGDDGGTWNPNNPVIVGGMGMRLSTASTAITGGLRTQGSAGIGPSLTTGGSIVLGANDMIALRPPRSRQTVMSVIGWPGGVVVGPPISGVLTDTITQPIPIPSRYLHHGDTSQIASVTLWLRLLFRPSGILWAPLTMGPWTAGLKLGMGAATPFALTNSGAPQGRVQIAIATGGAQPWVGSASYPTVGTYVTASTSPGSPPVWSYFRSTTTGTSSPAEPIWNTTPGAITNDNGIQWTCVGPMGVPYWPNPEAAFQNGLPQSVTLAFDPALSQTLDASAAKYSVSLNASALLAGGFGFSGNVLLHSLQFNFASIQSTMWE